MTAAGESDELHAFRIAYEEGNRRFAAGDIEGAWAQAADDIEVYPPPGVPERVIHGREAFLAFLRGITESLDGWTMKPREFAQAGPRTFVVGRAIAGSGRASGLVAETELWQIIDLDDRARAIRVREFRDRSQAFRAAGLADADSGSAAAEGSR